MSEESVAHSSGLSVNRPPDQLFQILSLSNELLPPSRFPSTIPPEKRDADHTAPLVALALPATAAGTRGDVTLSPGST